MNAQTPSPSPRTPTTRLAPSPTGALHLGNARTFLVNWCLARKLGWRVVLRMEDLDGPRVKQGAEQQAYEDLRWLGIDWDEGPTRQSTRSSLYADAAHRLIESRQAYPCVCTRKEVEQAASAPHAEDGAAVYGGKCRDRFTSIDEARAVGKTPAIRFRVPDDESSVITWQDEIRGKTTVDARTLGDFVIAKADGTSAYQLAVVVDDAEADVTHVVRGDDLVDSTPRQVLLYRALGMADRVPTYCHLPLVVGADGRRLAKRHGDTRLSMYREQGVPVGRVRALIARWCGVGDVEEETSIEELTRRLDLHRIPGGAITFTAEDDRRLRGSSS